MSFAEPGAFGFSEWPFRVVADQSFARVWADRTELRSDIERRLARLPVLGHSTVQLMWADFGAGKTHALRFIEDRCQRSFADKLLPIFTEVPVAADGLLD
ncbi:MAG: hypothetical protein ACRD5L_11710, partial [Bryobacteraceae bacterium]